MKELKILLIFTILGYCFPDTFDCESKFDNFLEEKCNEIDSCSYNPNDAAHPCVEIHNCESGSSGNCTQINPTNYLAERCYWDSASTSCKSTRRKCDDYVYNNIIGNNCYSLDTTTADARCALKFSNLYSVEKCEAHYKDCTKVTSNTYGECNSNIPEPFSKKCTWSSTCNPVDRYCNEGDKYFVGLFGKDKCSQLPLSGTNDEKSKKKCLYNYGTKQCNEVFINCRERTVGSSETCELYTPLDQNYDYDYSQKCIDGDSIPTGKKCTDRKRKCSEYSEIPAELRNEEICESLQTSQTYYRCAYDEENNRCKEQYNSCEDYINNKVETQRTDCENIVLKDKTKKCVYIQKTDECVTREIYPNCAAYENSDKKICESILSSDTNQYCILDKDSKCIEKPINCTEAPNKEMCLKVAKASDSNKRCAYGLIPPDYSQTGCYEEYIRCEDYSGTNESECEQINLYDGKKCKWESSSGTTSTNIKRCISNFKTCLQATTEEECKLIAKTGVSDPERKVCEWIGGCTENYKYCSDYRGTSTSTCSDIKPYDESGEKLDIGFKCSLEERSVGCQKVPVKCEDAKQSRSLCESYSQYIKDSDKKFCVYDETPLPDGSYCHSHYRKCEYIKHSLELASCPNNIIEGYIENACQLDDSGTKCITKNICSKLGDTYLRKRDFFVKRINANCSYLSPNGFKYKEQSCNQVTFYSNSTENKEICENITASKPYFKCVLKEDQSGCKEVYNEFNYSTASISYSTPPDASSQENSSGLIEKGIYLIMALFCLLV